MSAIKDLIVTDEMINAARDRALTATQVLAEHEANSWSDGETLARMRRTAAGLNGNVTRLVNLMIAQNNCVEVEAVEAAVDIPPPTLPPQLKIESPILINHTPNVVITSPIARRVIYIIGVISAAALPAVGAVIDIPEWSITITSTYAALALLLAGVNIPNIRHIQ